MEIQANQVSQNNFGKENKVGVFVLSWSKTYYKATVIKAVSKGNHTDLWGDKGEMTQEDKKKHFVFYLH